MIYICLLFVSTYFCTDAILKTIDELYLLWITEINLFALNNWKHQILLQKFQENPIFAYFLNEKKNDTIHIFNKQMKK